MARGRSQDEDAAALAAVEARASAAASEQAASLEAALRRASGAEEALELATGEASQMRAELVGTCEKLEQTRRQLAHARSASG